MSEPSCVIRAGIVAVACLFTLQLCACGSVPVNSHDQGQKESTKAKTYLFACDDEFGFVARTDGNSAWLFLPSGTVKTQKISNGEYRSGELVLWLNGEDALLETPGGERFSCSNNRRQAIWEHAKLNGADFRAIGNEPGWYMEIHNQSRLILVTNYGSERQEFDLQEPVINQASRTTRYEVTQDGMEMVLTIKGEPCYDSMSGEKFESAAEVLLNGKPLRGCGRALH